MEKFEKFSFLESSGDNTSNLKIAQKSAGIFPIIILIFLIVTTLLGVILTNQELESNLILQEKYSSRIASISNSNQRLMKSIEEMQKRKSAILPQVNRKKNITMISTLNKMKKNIHDLEKEYLVQKDKQKDLQTEKSKIADMISKLKEEESKEIKTLTKIKQQYQEKIPLFSSIIETKEDYSFISQLVDNNSFTLCYSSKNDGLNVDTFFKMCGKEFPTIALYQTDLYERFGGYSELPWDGSKGKKDKNAFIFNLDKRKKFLPQTNQNYDTIINSNGLFPSFGKNQNEFDFIIKENKTNPQGFGKSKFPIIYGKKSDKFLFCNNFKVLNIEIYSVRKK